MLENTDFSFTMQDVYDDLFAKSQSDECFEDLMHLVLDERNIFLAYHAIRSNKGSRTPGTDGRTIRDISCLPFEDVVANVRYFLVWS